MEKEERAKLMSAAIAHARLTLPKLFSLNDLIKALQVENCPYRQAIPSMLLKQGLIVKNHHKTYEFTSTEPIYFKHLLVELNSHSTRTRHQSIQLNTDDMIMFLKKEGYQILKPVITYEKC